MWGVTDAMTYIFMEKGARKQYNQMNKPEFAGHYELVKNIELPDIDAECKCQCRNMFLLMKRLEEMTDAEALKKILCKVRHGLHPSQCEWAYKEFMEISELDDFLNKHLNGFAMIMRGSILQQKIRKVQTWIQNSIKSFIFPGNSGRTCPSR